MFGSLKLGPTEISKGTVAWHSQLIFYLSHLHPGELKVVYDHPEDAEPLILVIILDVEASNF